MGTFHFTVSMFVTYSAVPAPVGAPNCWLQLESIGNSCGVHPAAIPAVTNTAETTALLV
jgi:hypothetical protein